MSRKICQKLLEVTEGTGRGVKQFGGFGSLKGNGVLNKYINAPATAFVLKEILAFLEGKRLDDLKAAEERGKRPYQKFLLVLASGLLGFFCSLLMLWLTKLL